MSDSPEPISIPRFVHSKGYKLYYWKYDDNTWGVAVRDTSQTPEKELLTHDVLASKNELKECIVSLQKKAKENEKGFRKKRLRIPTGLNYVEKSTIPTRDVYQAEESWDELEYFLNSCGTDDDPRKEVLRLFSGILTGYCARLTKPSLEKSTPLMDDAPLIAVGYEDNVFDFLFRAHLALAIDPDFDGKLFADCPSILPPAIAKRSLDECARIRLSKSKKKSFKETFPAQYRDTSVLIHSKFFTTKDIRSFRQRNRWASVVLYGNAGKKLCDNPIRLKASVFSKADFSWNPEAIQYLIRRFVYDLSNLKKQSNSGQKKIKRELERIKHCIFQYQQQKDTKWLLPAEQHWLTLQMLALSLFLKTCEGLNVFDKQKRKQIRTEWFNLLLPNCCTESDAEEDDEDGGASDENSVSKPEQNYQQLFEDILKEMLRPGNLRHFLFVSDGEPYDSADPDDPACQYWGYLRMFAPKNQKKAKFRALQFRQDDFEKIIPVLDERFLGVDIAKMINRLREKDPDYLHSTKTARFGNKKGTSPSAVVLMIDKLTFLDEDQQAFLTEKFPESNGKFSEDGKK